MDGWLENVGVPNPVTQSGDAWTGNVFSPRNYDHKVTFEERTRTNANLVFQYAPNDKLVVTADALYSDFDVESEATSYGHRFTALTFRWVMTAACLMKTAIAAAQRLMQTVLLSIYTKR